MEQAFIGILKTIIAEQGKKALLDPSRCKGFLADYATNEYKKERRLVALALDAGVLNALDATQELECCKKKQARLLHEDYSITAETAANLVDALALVLRGDASKTEMPPTPAPPRLQVPASNAAQRSRKGRYSAAPAGQSSRRAIFANAAAGNLNARRLFALPAVRLCREHRRRPVTQAGRLKPEMSFHLAITNGWCLRCRTIRR